MDNNQLQAALPEYFAPWVQALNLSVEACEASQVHMRLPFSENLCRVGGMVCGQDGLITASVIRAGKNLAFGEIDIRAADGKSVCRATTTYALL
jgi:acyl-coenzyme A thioesterase PaaI-like protein